MEFETAAHCYDSKTLVGKALGDILPGKLLDIKYLAEEIKSRHKKKLQNGKRLLPRALTEKCAEAYGFLAIYEVNQQVCRICGKGLYGQVF